VGWRLGDGLIFAIGPGDDFPINCMFERAASRGDKEREGRSNEKKRIKP